MDKSQSTQDLRFVALHNARQKTKFRYIVVSFLCLFCISGTVVTFLFIRDYTREKAYYQETLQAETRNMLSFFSQSLLASVNSCNSIYASRWYRFYRNNANIYHDYFDPMRRMEIQSELAAQVTSLTYVSDVLVITPPPLDSVICRNGWFSTDFFHQVHKNYTITYSEDATAVVSVTATDAAHVAIMRLPDPTPRRENGIICVLIDKIVIANAMNQILSPEAVYCRLELFGQTLYETGALRDDLVVTESASRTLPFSIRLASPPYQASQSKDHLVHYALLMVIVLLGSALISIFLADLFLRPVKKLVGTLGGDYRKIQDPYHFISESVAAYAQKNALLSDEQARMSQSIKNFLTMMHNEILNGMLTNPDFDYANDYVHDAFPWFRDDLPFFMVLLTPCSEASIEIPKADMLDALPIQALHGLQFTVLSGDRCLLYWFKANRTASAQRNQIEDYLRQQAGNKLCFALSKIMHRPEELHPQYVALKTDIVLRRQVEYTLPITTQISLTNDLQANKPEACASMLHEVQETTDPACVMSFLLRLAADYDVEQKEIKEQYNHFLACRDKDAKWATIEQTIRQLCTLIDEVRHESTYHMGKLIRSYIDEHYADQNLSMKQLADLSGMHRTQLSKMLKTQLGMTFSDYLQTLRVSKAIELMQQTRTPLSAIAEAVGYINYITFKNAFVRVKGTTPRIYRQAD
jgi:AraC-like DNA-binding protein